MSPATVSHADDQRVVAIETSAHLEQLASIEIVDRRQLSEVWLEVRRCDSAALDGLDGGLRQDYLCLVQERRRPDPTEDPGARPALRKATAHLRMAIHRRVMLLHLVPGTAACQSTLSQTPKQTTPRPPAR